MAIKIFEAEQGTEQWFKDRAGMFTASKAGVIAANGKGLETYCMELAAEIHTGRPKPSFGNEHTDRGNELEPEARSMYELETGNTVTEVGFMVNDKISKRAGASLDGIVGEDGVTEYKCMMDTKHMAHIFTYPEIKVERSHYMQTQMQMMISNRLWADYALYNPNFTQSLLIKRIEPDKVAYERILIGLRAGEKMVDEFLKKLNKKV